MKTIRRWLLWLLLAGLFAAGVVYSLWPRPLPVEAVLAARGPMQITINEDGMTRVRERYQVSSPVAGQLLRIELHSGDAIQAGQTLLATIRPSDPSMLDARQVAETEARAAAAKVTIDRADARRDQAKVARDLAETQFGRARQLSEKKAISQEEVEATEAAFRSRQEDLRVAAFEREIAQFEFEQAQAALGLMKPDEATATRNFEIRSPIDGSVLRVFRESAMVVSPGTSLLEVGNSMDLEIVVDVLSSDAVKIAPGDEMRLNHWGGDQSLSAKVRVVEPAAFTKISALGVEEQRVNVIGNFEAEQKNAGRLGDGYRVEAEIVIWKKDDVLQIPTAALFRTGAEWCAFVIDNGVVKKRTLEIGQRNELQAEVLSGLDKGTPVIIYPSDLVKDNISVIPTIVTAR